MNFFSKGGIKQKLSLFGGKASKNIDWLALPKLLTIKQVCEILDVHPNTLRNWDDSGRLKAVRVGARKDRRYEKAAIQKIYPQQHPAPPPAPVIKLPEPSDGGKYVLQPGWSSAKVKLLLISKKFSVFVYSIIIVAFSFFIVQSLFFAHIFVVQAEAQPVEQKTMMLEPTTTSGWENPDFAKYADVVASGALESFTDKNSAVYVNRPVVVKGESTAVPVLAQTAPATEEPATMPNANSATNSAVGPAAAASDQAPDLAKINPLFEASGFAKPSSASPSATPKEAVAVFSFGAASFDNNEDVVTFSYSADSGATWATLDSFALTTDVSNATHDGYWEFPITDKIHSLDDVAKIKLRANYSAVPGTTESKALLDSANLRLTFIEPPSISTVEKINHSVNLVNKEFASNESPKLDIAVEEKSKVAFLGGKPTKRQVKSVTLTDPTGKRRQVDAEISNSTANGVTTAAYTINPRELTAPGQYTVTAAIEQNGYAQDVTETFIWGALAMNPDQTTYKKGDTATFSIGALDEHGGIVCNADVTLTITDPAGKKTIKKTADKTIQVTDFCGKKELYQKQDMVTQEKLTHSGLYRLDLTATVHGNASSLTDTLIVEDKPAYTIERLGPTRVFPNIYQPMKLKVTVSDNFKGAVRELLPAAFEIKPENGGRYEPYDTGTAIVRSIVWDVNLKAGSTVTLGYTFKSPEKSPALYALGPASVGDWTEHRAWQLAIDPTYMWLLGNSTTAPSGWTNKTSYDYFLRGAATTAATAPTGGATSHTHTVSTQTISSPSLEIITAGWEGAGSNVPTTAHTHSIGSLTVGSANNDPLAYTFTLWTNDAGVPTSVPINSYALFDATPTAGSWTRTSAADGRLVKIAQQAPATAGTSDTHTHALTWGSLAAASGTISVFGDGIATYQAATAAHTHTAPAGTTSTSYTSVPSNIQTLVYQASAANAVPTGMIALFDATPPAGWTTVSGTSQTFNAQYIQAAASYSATPQSADTHSMANQTSGASGTGASQVGATDLGTGAARKLHTHTITASFNANTDHKPQYFDVIMAKCTSCVASTYSVGGNVYSDEGSTLITGTPTIRLLVNGSNTACGGGACTATVTSGAYTISNITTVSGDILLLYLDTGGTPIASTVTVENATNLTGINLYQNRLIVRHETGTSITNANLFTGLGSYSDTDIPFSGTSPSLTVASNIEMHVWTGMTYDPNGTVTTQGTGDLHVDDSATAYLDTATSTIAQNIAVDASATLNVQASTTVNGGTTGGVSTAGTLNHTAGTFTIGNGTDEDLSITAGTVTISGGNTVIMDDILFTGGTLNINAGSNVDVLSSGGNLTMSVNLGTQVLNLAGGSLDVGQSMQLNSGTVNLSGGTHRAGVTVDGIVEISRYAYGGMTFNMTDGDLHGRAIIVYGGETLTTTTVSGGTLHINRIAGANTSMNFYQWNTSSPKFYNLQIDMAGAAFDSSASQQLTYLNGSFIISASSNFTTNSKNMTVEGNWTNGGNGFTAGTGTVTMAGNGSIDGTTATAFYNLYIGDGTAGTVTVNGTDNPTIASSGTLTADTGDILSISSGKTLTLLTGSANIAGTGTISGAGTLIFNSGSGGPATATTITVPVRFDSSTGAIAATTFDARTYGGAVEIYGSATSNAVTANTGTYVFSSTFTTTQNSTGTTTVTFDTNDPTTTFTGAISIGANTIFSSSSSGTTNINGNLTNSGTFTHNSGTVTLAGSSQQTITGTLTFQNLIVTNVSGTVSPWAPSVIFANAITVSGTFTASTANSKIQFKNSVAFAATNVAMAPASSYVYLRSDTTVAWLFNVTNAPTVTRVDVSYSNASGGAAINASDGTSVNSGNNTNWTWPPTTITISGTADVNNANATVKVAVNGVAQAQTGTVGAGSPYSWSISSVTAPTVGQAVTVWVLSATDANETTGVTLYSGVDITGMVLTQNVLSIGSSQNQSLTLANVGAYTCSSSEDVMMAWSSPTLTVTGCTNSYSSPTISVLSGNTLTVGTTETLNSTNVTNAGTLTGTGNAAFSVAGNWTNSSTFNYNTSTVTFTSAATGKTINNGASSFYNVVFNGSGGAWSALTNGMTVTNDLTMTAGTLNNATGTADITVNGNVQCQTTCGTITFTAGTFSVKPNGGVTKTFGTNVAVATDWTFNTLLFSTGGSGTNTVRFNTTGTGKTNANSLQLSANGGVLIVDDETNDRVIDIGTGIFSNATNATFQASSTASLTAAGDVNIAGTFTPGTGTLTLDATDSGHTITNGTISTFYNLTLNGGAGSVWSPTNSTLEIDNDLLVIGGTLDNSGGTSSVTVNGNVQCSGTCGTINMSSGTFTQLVSASKAFGTNVAVATDWTFNNLTFTNTAATAPTITFNTTGTGQIIVSGNLTMTNGGTSLAVTDANNRILDVNGNFNISTAAVTFTAPASASFTVAGSWSNSGTFTHNSGTVIFDAGATGRTISTETFYNVTFNNASGGWDFGSSTLTVAGTLNMGLGTITAGTSTVIMTGTGAGKNIIGGAKTLNNLQISGTPISLITSNLTVSGTLTVDASKLFYIDTGITITVSGTAGVAGTGSIVSTGLLVFNNLTSGGPNSATINVDVRFDTSGGNMQAAVFDAIAYNGNVEIYSNNSFASTVTAPNTGTFTLGRSLTTTCTGSCTSLILDMDDASDPTVTMQGSSPDALVIGANTTFLAPSSTTVTLLTNFQNNGTFTHDSGTVKFSSTSSINGSVDTTFYNLIIGDNTNDTVTINGTDDPTVAGTLTFTAPVVTTNVLSIGAGRTVTDASTADISGTVGTISGAGTIIFNSSTTGGPGTAITISSLTRIDATAASIPAAVFDARTYGGAVEFYSAGGSARTITSAATGTYNFSSTVTTTCSGCTGGLTLDLDDTTDPTINITGALSIGASTTLQAPSGTSLGLAGSYTNSGTFTANGGTVTVNGSGAQTFAGTMTSTSAFGTMVITNSSGSYSGTCGDAVTTGVTFSAAMTTGTLTIATNDVRVKFFHGVTTTVSTSLTLTGTSGHRVVLRSDDGTAWTIAAPATRSVDYVDVAYSTVSGTAIDVTNGHSQDCTNNVNWTWPSAPITVSGIAYSDDGTTPLASSGGTFKVVNGTTGNTTSSAGGTDGSGNWSITGVAAPSNGDVLTIWINGATPDGTLVLKYGASCTGTPSCTGLALYQNRVILRNEHTGNLANSDFANCDNDSGTNCGDAQIGFTDNLSGTYNLSVSSGRKLYIWGGDNLTAGGTVDTTAAATAGNPDGDIYIAASATLDMAANTLSVGGDFVNAGTYTKSSGQLTIFTATGTGFTITPNSQAFQNVTFNGVGGDWSNSAAIVFTGDLTMTNGTFSGSQNVQFSGNVACGASTCGTINQSGIWSRSNTSNFNFGQSVSGATNDWTFGSIQLSPVSVSQTMTFNSVGAGTAKIIVSGLFYISANTFDPAITLTVDNNTNDRILEIGGNFSIGQAGGTEFKASNTAALTVSGSWTLGTYGVFTHNNNTVTFNGIGNKNINTGTSVSPFYNVIFNGSGTWSPLTNTLTIANDLTMTAGTLNNTLGTADVTVNGNVQCGATCGTINFGTSTTFTQTVSTNKNFGTNVAGATDWYFYNLAFANTAATTPTITVNGTNTGTITVSNNFTLTNNGTSLVFEDNTNDRTLNLTNVDIGTGTTLSAPSTATALYIAGNVTRTGTFTDNSGTVTLDGTSQQTLNSAMTTTTNDFNNLTVTNSSGTDPQSSPSVIFADAMTVTGTFTAATDNVKMRFQPAVAFTATAINFDAPTTGYIYLRSNTDTSAWNFNVSGTPVVYDVNVKDSNAVGGSQITATDATNYDATGNTNWNFGARITVSGTADANLGATVKLAFGGTLQKHSATIVTGTPNTWSIGSLIAPAAGTEIVLWIDNVANNFESTGVTSYDGTGDMTGMVLNIEFLSIGSANNLTLTQGDLGSVYNNTNDEDIMFTCQISGSCTLNVDDDGVYANDTLDILSGMTYTMTDDTINTHHLQIHGTLNAGTGNITLTGSWLNAGVFNASSSDVTFSSNGSETIAPGGNSFYNVTFNDAGGDWTNTAQMTITHNLTLSAGQLIGTQNVTVNGDVVCGITCGTINRTGGTFTQSVSAAQNFGTAALASNWTFNDLTFSGSTRTVTSQGTGTITVNGTLTVSTGHILDAGAKTWTLAGTGTAFTLSGSLTASTSTFQFQKTTANSIPATTYYNLAINPGTGTPTYTLQNATYTIGGNLTISSNVTITPGTSSVVMTGTGKAADTQDKTLYDFSTSGTATVSLTSALYADNNISIGSGTTLSGSQNVTSIGGSFTGDGTVTLTGGTTTLEGTGTLGGSSTTDWTLNSLSLTQPTSCASICSAACDRTTSTGAGSGKMIVTGQITGSSCNYGDIENPATSVHNLNAGAKTWDLTYTGAPFSSVNFSRGTSTVRYIGTGNMTVSALTYYSLVLQPSGGTPIYTLGGGLTVGKDLTIASTLNLNEGTATVSVGGLGLTSTVDVGDQTLYNFDTGNGGTDIMNLTSNVTTTNTLYCHVNDTVNITAGKTMTIEDNANAFNSALFADDATCTFSGGTVKYRDANAPDSLMVINSDFIYDATTTNQAAPARSFGGNLTFENSGASARVITPFAGTHTVTGNLTVQSTGAGGLTVAGATSNPTVNITGNLSYGSANSKIITSGSGTWTVTGNVDFTNGTYTASTNNTLIMDGTTKVFTHNSQALYNFTVNGSISMSTGNETVSGTLTINNTKSLTSTSGILSVAGNFTNNGTFNANGGTVALTTSAAATIAGSNTFYNLSVTGVGAAKTVNFTGNTTTTVSGAFTITGASGQVVTLQSTDLNSWTINPATASADYASVSRSTNTGVTFCATNSTDGGNNINWNFSGGASCGVVVSGTIYTDEGTTPYQCATTGNLTVTTKVNGSGGRSATCLTDGGTYSMYVSATAGQPIIAFIDNGTPKAATVTRYNAGTVSGLNLYQNRVIVRHEDAGPITNTDLAQYDYNDDIDIPFTSNLSGTYNLVVNAGTKLFVWANKTFTPGGTVTTTAASTAVNPDGDIYIDTGATLAMAANDLSVGGDWQNYGSFSHSGTQTTTFAATGTGFSIRSNASPFHNLTFNGSGGDWTETDALAIDNDLAMTNGSLLGSQNVSVGGSVTGASTITLSGGTFTQSPSTTANFGTTSGANDWTFNDLTFSNAAATSPTITFALGGSGQTIVNGTLALTNGGTALIVNDNTNDRIIDANGTVSIGASTTLQAPPTASFTVAGNWTNSNVFTADGGTVTFDAGSTGKTITDGGSDWGTVVFNNSNGGWSFADATIMTGNLTVTAGALSGTADITVNGGAVTGSGTINLTGGTFLVDGAGNFGGTTGWNFSSLTFGDGTGVTATTKTGANQITASGVLTIAANQELNASSSTWVLSGSGTPLVINGTFTPSSSTFQYTGTGTTNVTSTTYGTLTLQPASGTPTYNLAGNINAGGDLNLASGLVLNAGTTLVTMTGTSNNIIGGGQSLYDLAIDPSSAGTITLPTSDLTISHTLTVAAGDALSLSSGRVLTDTGSTDIAGTGTISGAGTLRFTDTSGGPGTTLTTLSSIVRYDATANNIAFGTIDARAYGSDLEFYSNTAATRSLTFGAGTFDITGNLKVITGASQSLVPTVDGSSQNPTVNVTSDLTFTKGGSATPAITTGSGIWTVSGNVTLTNGTLTATTGNTLRMNGTTKAITSAAQTLQNFAVTGGSVSSADAMDVNGTWSLTSGTFTQSATTNMNIAGNFTLADGTTFNKSATSGIIIFDGDLQYNDQHTTKVDVGDVQIGASPQTTTLTSNMKAHKVDIKSSDTLITDGYDMDIGTGGITVENTGTPGVLNASDNGGAGGVSLINTEDKFDNSGTFTSGTSTLTFDGTPGSPATVTLKTSGSSLYNLVVNDPTNANLTVELQDALTAGGDITITQGTLDTKSGVSNAIALAGNWLNASTFTAQSGTVTFNGTASGKTINPGSSSFYNLTFDGSGGAWSPLTNTVAVTNDLIMKNGTFDTSNGTANVTVNGNVQCNTTCGTINMTSTNTFTQSVAADKSFGTNITGTTNWTFYNLTFTGTSGVRTITANGTGTGQIIVTNDLSTTNSGTSLALDDNTNDRILDVGNDVSIGTGTTLSASNSASFTVAGSWTTTGAFTHNGGTVTFDAASGTKSINPGSSAFGTVTFNNAGGTWQPTSNTLTVANNLNVTAGTMDNETNDQILDVGGDVTIGGSGVLQASSTASFTVGGAWTNTGTFTANSGLVTFDAGTGTKVIDSTGASAASFNNLTLNDGGGPATFQLGSALDVNGNLTITGGTLDTTSGSNWPITIAGNWTNNDTFTAQSGTVTADGAAQQTFSGTLTGATGKFNNLTITNVSGSDPDTSPSVIFSGNAETAGTFTAGTANTKLRFNAGSTYTLQNISFNGQAQHTRVYLRSSSGGSAWNLNSAGTRTVKNTDVKDSYACGQPPDIDGTHVSNQNSGGNTCWNFQALTFTLSTNSLNLGTLSTGAVATASHTVQTVTSADNGYVTLVYVDGDLRSGSNTINAASVALSVGTEGYGIATSDAGQTITQDTSCGSAPYNVTALTMSQQTVAGATSGPADETSTVCYQAAIASDTVAGSYSQIVTFVTVGLF